MVDLVMVVIDDPTVHSVDFRYILCASKQEACKCITDTVKYDYKEEYCIEDDNSERQSYSYDEIEDAITKAFEEEQYYAVDIDGVYYRIVTPELYGELCKD